MSDQEKNNENFENEAGMDNNINKDSINIDDQKVTSDPFNNPYPNSTANNGTNYSNSNYNNSNYNTPNTNNSGYGSQNYNNPNYSNLNNSNPYYSNAYNNPNFNNPNNSNSGYGSNNPYNNMNYNSSYYQQNYNNSNPNPWNNGNANAGKKVKEKKPRNGKASKVLSFVGKAACFGLIAAFGFFGFQSIYARINPDSATNNIISLTDTKDYEIGLTETGSIKTVNKNAVSEVAKNTLPAIVSINSTSTQSTQWFGQVYDQPVEGSGSGIIVGENENELLIATNNHVVEGATEIEVTFADGSQAAAIVKGTDATADLAVITVDISTLKQETLDAITVAKLGNSDEVKVGEMAIAIGNALGSGQSVTVGYVSAKDREVEISDGYDSKTMVLLQTDAAINPGNSGGALLNVDGEVIGINTVKYASYEVEGMGYAIPISKATPIITELMNREVLKESEQGYLGIAGNDVTEDVASFYNMPLGVYINETPEGGAAMKAGLKSGDIITGADDIEITSITQLRDYVNSKRVGTEVKITYSRNSNGVYEESTVTVTLGQNPNLNSGDE
ncbi:MAG: trypsin-like peptidase domain-containing protein [Mobilitalea sp.]